MRFIAVVTGLTAVTGVLASTSANVNVPLLKQAYELALESVGGGLHKRQNDYFVDISAVLLTATFDVTIPRVIDSNDPPVEERANDVDIVGKGATQTPDALKNLLKGTMTSTLESLKPLGTPSNTIVDKPKLLNAFDMALEAVGAGSSGQVQRRSVSINALLLTATFEVTIETVDGAAESVGLNNEQAQSATGSLTKSLEAFVNTADLVGSN